MKFKKFNLEYKGKKFSVNAKDCSAFMKIKGLMFTRKKKAKSLLFELNNPKRIIGIHSFFVFFPFLLLWLDEKNKIVDYKIMKPFGFPVFPKTKSSKIIEIPFNEKYSEIKKIFE